MPDEVGTEATRSDVTSADESLFGDPVDDRAGPVVQEEDSTDAAPDEPDGGGSPRRTNRPPVTPMSRRPARRPKPPMT